MERHYLSPLIFFMIGNFLQYKADEANLRSAKAATKDNADKDNADPLDGNNAKDVTVPEAENERKVPYYRLDREVILEAINKVLEVAPSDEKVSKEILSYYYFLAKADQDSNFFDLLLQAYKRKNKISIKNINNKSIELFDEVNEFIKEVNNKIPSRRKKFQLINKIEADKSHNKSIRDVKNIEEVVNQDLFENYRDRVKKFVHGDDDDPEKQDVAINKFLPYGSSLSDDFLKRNEGECVNLVYYTSMQTALKILGNQQIQPGSLIAQNDPDEIFFGIEHVLNDENSFSFRRNGKFLEVLASNFVVSTAYEVFKDDLVMWRGYGDQGSGVALVFEVKKIDPENDYKLIPMEYISKDSKKISSSDDEQSSNQTDQPNGNDSKIDDYQDTSNCKKLVERLVGIKDAFWSSENEIRLHFSVDDKDQEKKKVKVDEKKDQSKDLKLALVNSENSLHLGGASMHNDPNSNVSRIYTTVKFGFVVKDPSLDKSQESQSQPTVDSSESASFDKSQQIKLKEIVLGPKRNIKDILLIRHKIDDKMKGNGIMISYSRGSFR